MLTFQRSEWLARYGLGGSEVAAGPAIARLHVERMPHPAIISPTVRVSVCWVLLAFCWVALWLALRGLLPGAVFLVGLPILLISSCLLPRTQRTLAWLCWMSILGIIFLAKWLPAK